MTRESVYIYDSQFPYPFHYFGNLNLDDLTSIAWNPKGDILVISSIESYNTFLTIDLEAIGNKHPNSSLYITYEAENIAPDSPKLAKAPKKKKTKDIKEKLDETKEIAKEVNILTPRSIKAQKTLSEFFKSSC